MVGTGGGRCVRIPILEHSLGGRVEGTVSVVDGAGGSFGRIWCVYELFLSLTTSAKDQVSDDMCSPLSMYSTTH